MGAAVSLLAVTPAADPSGLPPVWDLGGRELHQGPRADPQGEVRAAQVSPDRVAEPAGTHPPPLAALNVTRLCLDKDQMFLPQSAAYCVLRSNAGRLLLKIVSLSRFRSLSPNKFWEEKEQNEQNCRFTIS